MTFLHLLDIVFFLMAVASWITAGEVRNRYHKRIADLDTRIAEIKKRQEELHIMTTDLLDKLHNTIGPIERVLRLYDRHPNR